MERECTVPGKEALMANLGSYPAALEVAIDQAHRAVQELG